MSLSFEQTDENEFTLMVEDGQIIIETPLGTHWIGDARVKFTQHEAHELWQALDKTIGAHYREGLRAGVRAALQHEVDRAMAAVEAENDRLLEQADLARKAAKEA